MSTPPQYCVSPSFLGTRDRIWKIHGHEPYFASYPRAILSETVTLLVFPHWSLGGKTVVCMSLFTAPLIKGIAISLPFDALFHLH